MTLFCLLCVILVLGGWAVRREACATFEQLRLRFFGVRVPVHRSPEPPLAVRRRVAVPSAPSCPLPPPCTATRPGS
ncbi:MAG TPA: hypothetical protein VMS17_26300 [Gemmataceae bacterium]|nr:hypothetical protein [Gemmataceae bacterium]